MTQPKTLKLADYKKPAFTTDEVELDFDIYDDATYVTSHVIYTRTPEGTAATELVLNAENPNPKGKDFITAVLINGVPVSRGHGNYKYDEKNNELRITVPTTEDKIEVEIETYLEPQNNKALTGLYQSDSCVVTQCESEGFRRITPFLDRPDVMATYKVTVEASEKTHPVLMANGNKVKEGHNGNGRHWAEFHDPWPKPSYLFATANGNLEAVEDTYTTGSGRKVNCRVYTEKGQSEKAQHALDALKLSMKWDEDVFDCEYDLDDYNVVAVSKFNFGAMENKGLNVFRDSLIMASPETATDAEHQRIIDVVGHEYFHNYSGNRVTLANWFNISLKEGLTVTREQMFTAFTTTEATQRIEAVKALRAVQFPEDDGPLRHPVMAQEVQSMENLYDMTVYEKGAEVIRMMGQMMGEDKLIEGIKHYFKTHDGQAVTIKDFVKCMEDVSGLDLSNQFDLWYTQSGRPRVKADGQYNPDTKTYTLTLEQSIPTDKAQPVKKPMMIPIKMGLVDDNGQDMHEETIILTQDKQTFTFENIDQEPAFHSLLRGFSAPVDLDPGLTEDQLYKQLLTDTDGFNRWDAGQKIAMSEMKRLYDAYLDTGKLPPVRQRYIDTIRQLVNDQNADPALTALAVSRPSIKEFEAVIGEGHVEPSTVSAVNKHIKKTLGKKLGQDYKTAFNRSHDGQPYKFDYDSVGKRDLKRAAVANILAKGDKKDLQAAESLYFNADNMTDQMIVMSHLASHPSPEQFRVMDDFYNRFKDDALTIQKWLATKASENSDTVIDDLEQITQTSVFKWDIPGHVSSVFGGLAANYDQFHRLDGKGYAFVADAVIELNTKNPNAASRVVGPLTSWRKYKPDHQKLMITQLDRIAAEPSLSKDVYEKVSKALPDDTERNALGLKTTNSNQPKPSGP